MKKVNLTQLKIRKHKIAVFSQNSIKGGTDPLSKQLGSCYDDPNCASGRDRPECNSGVFTGCNSNVQICQASVLPHVCPPSFEINETCNQQTNNCSEVLTQCCGGGGNQTCDFFTQC